MRSAPLRRAFPFVLVPRRSILVPTLVDLLDGRFQPPCRNQSEHRAVHDAPPKALHQFGVGIESKYPLRSASTTCVCPLTEQFTHVADRMQRAALRAVGVLLALQIGLEYRL